MKNIYLFCAPSGCGKTRITTELEKRFGLKVLQSYTTRPKRTPNEYGHIFVTDEEFDRLNDMVAYTYYNGHKYCATTEQVENNDLYVIDIDGVEYFKKSYNGNKNVKIIALETPIDLRMARMALQGRTEEQIKQRIKIDTILFKKLKNIANVIFENNNLDITIKEIYDYICEQERGI